MMKVQRADMCVHGFGCSKQGRTARCCPFVPIVSTSSSGKSSSILHSLEFVPSDNHLFIHPKQFLAVQSLTSDQQTKGDLQDWLKGLAASFFDEGNQNLVRRCDMCLDLHSDYSYVEKQLNGGTSMLQ